MNEILITGTVKKQIPNFSNNQFIPALLIEFAYVKNGKIFFDEAPFIFSNKNILKYYYTKLGNVFLFKGEVHQVNKRIVVTVNKVFPLYTNRKSIYIENLSKINLTNNDNFMNSVILSGKYIKTNSTILAQHTQYISNSLSKDNEIDVIEPELESDYIILGQLTSKGIISSVKEIKNDISGILY